MDVNILHQNLTLQMLAKTVDEVTQKVYGREMGFALNSSGRCSYITNVKKEEAIQFLKDTAQELEDSEG